MSSRRWLESLIFFIPASVWYGLIWLLSNQPKLPGPGDKGVYDFVWFKSGHLLVYTVLALLLLYGFAQGARLWQNRKALQKHMILSWITLIILATLDEYHQSFIPGRTPRLTDIFIDSLGSGAVLFLLERYNAFLPQSLRKLKTTFGM